MSLASDNHACGYDTKDESAEKTDHKGRSYHGAAMTFVCSTFSCSQLDVALFAVHMWFWLENACDGLNNGFGRICCWCGRRAVRGVDRLVGMRVKFDIIVLCNCCILNIRSARYLSEEGLESCKRTPDVDPDGVYRLTGWSLKTSS
jgi:hypothetical protein